MSFALSISVICRSQFTVNLPETPAEVFQLTSLWNTVLINSGPPIKCKVTFTLKSRTNFEVVVNTRVIEIKTGVIALAKYSNEAEVIFKSSGGVTKIPFGEYDLCCSVVDISGEELGYDCIEQKVDPVSPPQLLSPSDEDEIYTLNPMLIWLPPAPAEGMKIDYKLEMVEISAGQSKVEAVERNTRIYENTFTNSLSTLYPYNAPLLKHGAVYAWRVSANYQEFNLGVTEVWSFKIAEQTKDSIEEKKAFTYPALGRTAKGEYYVFDKAILFSFPNSTKEDSFTIRILAKDYALEDRELRKAFQKDSKYKYSIKAKGLKRLSTDEYYTLEAEDTAGKKYYLKFKLIN